MYNYIRVAWLQRGIHELSMSPILFITWNMAEIELSHCEFHCAAHFWWQMPQRLLVRIQI